MWLQLVELLALLVAANGAPILAARLVRDRAAWPIDLGSRLADGQPLFGVSKTWRGLVAASAACVMVAAPLDYPILFGLEFAGLAMTGDLLSSFTKRRLGIPSSGRSPGLDQLPEALLPSIYAVWALGLPWWWSLLLPLLFTALQMLVSEPLYRLRIRRRPH